MKKSQLNIEIPEDLKRRFLAKCKAEGVTATALIADLARSYVSGRAAAPGESMRTPGAASSVGAFNLLEMLRLWHIEGMEKPEQSAGPGTGLGLRFLYNPDGSNPVVELYMNGQLAQMSPMCARNLGQEIIGAAVAAEITSELAVFLRNSSGGSAEDVDNFLQGFTRHLLNRHNTPAAESNTDASEPQPVN